MQELKLKILQCGNGVSINEIMEDIEKLVVEEYTRGRNAGFVEASSKSDEWIEAAVSKERERILKEVKESGLPLGYKNHVISIVKNNNTRKLISLKPAFDKAFKEIMLPVMEKVFKNAIIEKKSKKAWEKAVKGYNSHT